MASLLGSRNFATGGSGGSSAIVRAKRLADLYIRQNTNDAGDVTDPEVYSYVINNILSPYVDDVTVQQKVATYQNKVKDLNSKSFEQDNTISQFKQNVSEAIYSRGDVIRDPSQMALYSAAALDNIVNGIDAAIAYGESTKKSTDRLVEYRKEVMAMAGGQRDLVNALNSGATPQTLDGYGYFVKTNPIDGSLVGAALLPVNSAPAEVKQNTKRIENTIGVGNSKLPVYLPVTKDADGQVTARLYGNTWKGTDNDTALAGDGVPNFKNKDAFDITDTTIFPIKKNDLVPGSFGRVVSGVKDGQTQFSYFYRGQDGKARQLDEEGINAFRQDPIFAPKLNGYIPLLAPDEVKALGNIDRLNPSDVPKWSNRIGLENKFNEASLQQQKDEQRFKTLDNPVLKTLGNVGGAISGAVQNVAGFFSGRKNKQDKPEVAPQGDQTSYSSPDVVDRGKKIFAGGGGGNVA